MLNMTEQHTHKKTIRNLYRFLTLKKTLHYYLLLRNIFSLNVMSVSNLGAVLLKSVVIDTRIQRTEKLSKIAVNTVDEVLIFRSILFIVNITIEALCPVNTKLLAKFGIL